MAPVLCLSVWSLHPDLGCPAQKDVELLEWFQKRSCRDAQRTGKPFLGEKAERDGLDQPGEGSVETPLQPSSTERELINRMESNILHGLILTGQEGTVLN